MNKKILNEVSRINNIMGNEPVILEQATAVRLLKKLFSNLDTKSLKRIVKSTDDDIKNIIEKIKKGDDVSDNQMSKLFKVIDFSLMAKKLIENKAFSSAFNNKIDDFIVDVKAGRTDYGPGLQRMYDGVDEMLKNEPLELVDAVKVEMKRIVDDGIKDGVTKKSLSSSLATQSSKLLQKFGYTRNIGRLISVMSDYKKDKEKLISEIENLINSSLEGTDNISKITSEIENKLLSIEAISDNAAKTAITDITKYFKRLSKSGEITKGDYEKVITHFGELKKGDIWKQVIDPLNSEIEKGISGWSSVRKKLVPLKRVKNKETGKVVWTWEDKTFTRLVNFLVFQSTQTGLDILKRFITKKNGKYFFGKIPITKTNKVVIETYLRAIVFKVIIPILAPLYWTGRFKTSDYAVTDLEVDNVLFNPERNEELRDKMKKSWEDSIDNDGFFNQDSEIQSWTVNDFTPALSSYIDDIAGEIGKWISSSDKSETTNSVNNDTVPTDTQLEYTLDAVKSAAPENVRPYIWKNEDNILLRTSNSAGKLVDYKITLENGEYIVDMGTPKKLKDIK